MNTIAHKQMSIESVKFGGKRLGQDRIMLFNFLKGCYMGEGLNMLCVTPEVHSRTNGGNYRKTDCSSV